MHRSATAVTAVTGLAAVVTALTSAQPVHARPPAPTAIRGGDAVDLVNPFVGTAPGAADFGTGGGAGNTFPGATVPFGMVQFSPDTDRRHPGGYRYADHRITGFSLTHFSGAGCTAFGDIPIMPFAGSVTTSPATDPGRYAATFTHSGEKASPGYYAVRLGTGTGPGIGVELTATRRTGAARFTFDPHASAASVLVTGSGSANGTDDAAVSITGPDTITGWASSGAFCGAGNHYRVYFAARFSRPFTSVGTWHDGAVHPGATSARGGSGLRPAGAGGRAPEGFGGRPVRRLATDPLAARPGSGAWVAFDPSRDPVVTVRIGLSFVDVSGAEGNLRAESAGRTVAELRARARRQWARRLDQIRVGGGTRAERATFYTCLYHVLVHPNVFSDTDGRYTGFDGRVHTTESGHVQYANFSGWDIYRSQVQLLALLAPARASDIARSLLNQADQGGAWDRWSQANDFTGVMVGDPYQSIVASLYAFGARDFDAHAALASMVAGASTPAPAPGGYDERPDLGDYLTLGYLPAGAPGVWGPAATTLEYAVADFGVASLAGALGAPAVRREFLRRSGSWRALFDPATGFLRPRDRDGSFAAPFDPADTTGFVEGNAAQYTWMVPFDPRGLFAAMGGNAAVVRRLDQFFTRLDAGPTAPFAFLGNEPTLATPWLYDYAGAPWRTQAVVRQAVATLFSARPDGLVGNDDLGELSSWYVWAALGVYPQVPGRAELVLASPLFPRAVIRRPTGQVIVIDAPGAGPAAPYLRSLRVNGQRSDRPWLPANFVARGGRLDVTVAATPDRTWGTDPADAPPSFPPPGRGPGR